METREQLSARGRRRILPAAAALVLVFAGAGWWTCRAHADAGAANATPPRPRAQAAALRTSFADVLEAVTPAVVNVRSTKVAAPARTRRGERSPDGFPFRFFFPQPDDGSGSGPERDDRALGSGVIVRSDGVLLTNNHVVEGADQVKVALADGRELTAKVLGTDPQTDVAVLKIDAKDLPVLPIGHSGDLRVGDVVFAVGNPFGVGQSVTMGIVGATGRTHLGILGNSGYEDFIQTDAAINPGNSGGALVDSNGELIGINTLIIAHGAEGNQGVGFAVPIDMAQDVMKQILDGGKVRRSRLGVAIGELTPAVASAMGVEAKVGVVVSKVMPDSPAEKAGIAPGDVIVQLDGEALASEFQFRLGIAGKAPGTRVRLGIVRDRKPQTITVTLDEQVPDEVAENRGGDDVEQAALRGVRVRDLTPQLRQQLDLVPGDRGVVVTDVSGGPAADAGLQPGDVITEVKGGKVASVTDFRRRVHEAGDGALPVLVKRDGSSLFLVVEP